MLYAIRNMGYPQSAKFIKLTTPVAPALAALEHRKY